MLTQAYQNSRQLVPAEKLGPDKPQGSIDIQYFPVENGSHRPGQVRDITIQNLCQTIRGLADERAIHSRTNWHFGSSKCRSKSNHRRLNAL